MAEKKTIIDRPMGGLFMMIIFTIIWTILAEYYFNDYDYRITGILFGLAVIYFIYYSTAIYSKKHGFGLLAADDSYPSTGPVKDG